MKNRNGGAALAGGIVYAIGLLAGLVFNGLAFWGDLEGNGFWNIEEFALFDPTQTIPAKLDRLKCPLLIISPDTEVVSAAVTNTSTQPADLVIQADISNPNGTENYTKFRQPIHLAPAQRSEFSWPIHVEDRLYGRLVLVRVYLFKEVTSGAVRSNFCGVLALDWPGWNADLLIVLAIGFSLLCLLTGGGIWLANIGPENRKINHMKFGLAWLLAFTLAGIGCNLAGYFFLEILCLVVALISIVSLLEITLVPKGS